MGSTRKGMLNVLIAAVLCGEFRRLRAVHHGAKPYVVTVPDDDTFVIRRLILVTFSFMHGDKIFSILKNRKGCTESADFLRGGRAHRSANLPAHD
ncbi:Permease of the drug/metabolite transporter (DMT) superfamily [Salmonella enterica subsp. enterica]|nr:Permease of the drug/metabolite transporter (DMT) superfamily [Salmonella enterica subsp. enterica]